MAVYSLPDEITLITVSLHYVWIIHSLGHFVRWSLYTFAFAWNTSMDEDNLYAFYRGWNIRAWNVVKRKFTLIPFFIESEVRFAGRYASASFNREEKCSYVCVVWRDVQFGRRLSTVVPCSLFGEWRIIFQGIRHRSRLMERKRLREQTWHSTSSSSACPAITKYNFVNNAPMQMESPRNRNRTREIITRCVEPGVSAPSVNGESRMRSANLQNVLIVAYFSGNAAFPCCESS